MRSSCALVVAGVSAGRPSRGVLALGVVFATIAASGCGSDAQVDRQVPDAISPTITTSPSNGTTPSSISQAPVAPTPTTASSPSRTAPATSDGKAPVDVVVSWSGWDAAQGRAAVGAYVPSVVEDGGTCRLTLTKGTEVVTGEQAAAADADSTSCGELSVPVGAGGTWTATVTYTSKQSSGSSAPVEIEAP